MLAGAGARRADTAAQAHARPRPPPAPRSRYRSAKQTSRRDAKSILHVRISAASLA